MSLGSDLLLNGNTGGLPVGLHCDDMNGYELSSFGINFVDVFIQKIQ
jgi:hypothetical protein